MVVVSISGESKLLLLSTWMRYAVAAATVHQSNLGVASLAVLPFFGDVKVGAAGTIGMTTIHGDDHALTPQLFAERTRQ